MKKSFFDYVHCYVNGRVPFITNNSQAEVNVKTLHLIHDYTDEKDDKPQLILRPLSSMTPGDFRQAFNQVHFTDDFCKEIIDSISQSHWNLYTYIAQYGNEDTILYLFEMGFDVFALIKRNLAVDATVDEIDPEMPDHVKEDIIASQTPVSEFKIGNPPQLKVDAENEQRFQDEMMSDLGTMAGEALNGMVKSEAEHIASNLAEAEEDNPLLDPLNEQSAEDRFRD